MHTTTRTAALGVATALALAAAQPAASADGYQYIVSGWPSANASHSGNSASGALEARRRTFGDSAGTALNSTKAMAFVVIIR
jgi:hypothetical protein